MAFLRKAFQKHPTKSSKDGPIPPEPREAASTYRLSAGLRSHQLAPAPASPLNLRVPDKLLPSILSQETPG